MTTITDYEPHIDTIISRLVERLATKYCSDSSNSQVCDIGNGYISVSCLRFVNSALLTFDAASFDFIAEMTWSGALGFLEEGKDVHNMIQTMENDMDYFATARINPTLLIQRPPFINA